MEACVGAHHLASAARPRHNVQAARAPVMVLTSSGIAITAAFIIASYQEQEDVKLPKRHGMRLARVSNKIAQKGLAFGPERSVAVWAWCERLAPGLSPAA
jgi:hypothetical protein